MEPCPLGVLLSGHRQGACQALVWQANDRQYRCGAITSAHHVLDRRLPRFAHGLLPMLRWLLEHLAKRWVAAGVGCDCNVDIGPNAPHTHPANTTPENATMHPMAKHLAAPCSLHHRFIDIDPLA